MSDTPSSKQLAADNVRNCFFALASNFALSHEMREKWLAQILSNYEEKQRYYHTLCHISDMLRLSTEHKADIINTSVMNLAILFHDIEYDPKAKDNELQSILQFKSFAEDAHLSPSIAESVALFIERTITHTLEGDGDNLLPNTRKDLSLFLDMDLEVLSRQKGEYEKYAHQIRQEYSHFSHQDYCTGRAKVLRSFLERDRLYFSEIFYNQGESAARRNIKEEIQVLEGHFE